MTSAVPNHRRTSLVRSQRVAGSGVGPRTLRGSGGQRRGVRRALPRPDDRPLGWAIPALARGGRGNLPGSRRPALERQFQGAEIVARRGQAEHLSHGHRDPNVPRATPASRKNDASRRSPRARGGAAECRVAGRRAPASGGRSRRTGASAAARPSASRPSIRRRANAVRDRSSARTESRYLPESVTRRPREAETPPAGSSP